MLVKQFSVILVGFGIFAAASVAVAQSDDTHEKTFFDRLDDFGKSIFGGILPSDNYKPQVPAPSTKPPRANST